MKIYVLQQMDWGGTFTSHMENVRVCKSKKAADNFLVEDKDNRRYDTFELKG